MNELQGYGDGWYGSHTFAAPEGYDLLPARVTALTAGTPGLAVLARERPMAVVARWSELTVGALAPVLTLTVRESPV